MCSEPLTENSIYPNFSLDKVIKKSAMRKGEDAWRTSAPAGEGFLSTTSRSLLTYEQKLKSIGKDGDWSTEDIDNIVSALISKKKLMETQERELQLDLLESFLLRSKKETEEAIHGLQRILSCLRTDLETVQHEKNGLRPSKQGYSSGSPATPVPNIPTAIPSTQPTPSLLPQILQAAITPPLGWSLKAGKDGNIVTECSVKDNAITDSSQRTSKKRQHDEINEEDQPPLEMVEPEAPLRQNELATRVKKIYSHFEDLQDCYFESRLLPDGSMRDDSPKSLTDFSSSLSRFSKLSGYRTLAKIQYDDNSLATASSIVSTIEFDKDDEYFATAGVTRKIRVFEYSNVVMDYREHGFNLGGGSQRRDLQNFVTASNPTHTRWSLGAREADSECEQGTRTSGSGEGGDDEAFVGDEIPRYPILEMGGRAKISCVSWNSYIKSHLVASDYEGVVTLWDSSQGVPITQFEEHEKRAWSVDFSRLDPVLAASGGDDTKVKIWSTNQKGSVATISSKANICSVKWNPEVNRQIAFGSADHHVHYYDLRNTSKPLHVLQGHRKAVSYVQFLASGQVVSASTDCTLRLWNVSNNTSTILSSTAGSPATHHSTTVGSGAITPLNSSSLRRPSSLLNLVGSGRSVLSSLFGTASSRGSSIGQGASPSIIANTGTGTSNVQGNNGMVERCLRTYSGHTNEKNFVGLSVNSTGEFIACGSETNSVYTYYSRIAKPVIVHRFGQGELVNGRVPEDDPSHFVSSVCFKRKNPEVLVAANSQGRIKVLEMK
ncbi:hypothetical protein HDV05_000523 [Chytridiales sp. JEL 0842]|nr:hypothetical protein HDV05_000523 [Chytridiales sp. JEL 0842]